MGFLRDGIKRVVPGRSFMPMKLDVRHSYDTAFIQNVFSKVAKRYDLMNDLMSMGIHRIWKDVFVKEAVSSLSVINSEIAKAQFEGIPYEGQNVVEILDLAGGTGDIAFRILERAGDMNVHDDKGFVLYNTGIKAEPKITILDPSVEMTDVGQQYADKLGYSNCIEWVNAPAENMPLENDTFDIVTVAFGLRNFTDREAGLRECYRVLKPGGRLMILEFSRCESNLLGALYDSYSSLIIPMLGQYVANNKDAYQYLIDSIRTFPSQQQLADMLTKANFTLISYRNLTGGIVAIHSAFKKQ